MCEDVCVKDVCVKDVCVKDVCVKNTISLTDACSEQHKPGAVVSTASSSPSWIFAS